jgi:hypothetical protein
MICEVSLTVESLGFVGVGVGVGVGVLLAADRQSTSSSGYRASLWDPRPDFIMFFFSADNYLIILSKASSVTRKRVCSLQCNHSLVPITILYRLI